MDRLERGVLTAGVFVVYLIAVIGMMTAGYLMIYNAKHPAPLVPSCSAEVTAALSAARR